MESLYRLPIPAPPVQLDTDFKQTFLGQILLIDMTTETDHYNTLTASESAVDLLSGILIYPSATPLFDILSVPGADWVHSPIREAPAIAGFDLLSDSPLNTQMLQAQDLIELDSAIMEVAKATWKEGAAEPQDEDLFDDCKKRSNASSPLADSRYTSTNATDDSAQDRGQDVSEEVAQEARGSSVEEPVQQLIAPLPCRQDWTTIRAITPDQLMTVFVAALAEYGTPIKTDECTLEGSAEGSFHRVTFVKAYHEDEGVYREYVIKIPAIGVTGRWRRGDLEMMGGEIYTLQHIRSHSNVPVPRVYGYSYTTDNPIGSPYMIQERLPGRPAYLTWFNVDRIEDIDLDAAPGDVVDAETQRKRDTILRSLARYMSQLQQLHWTEIGMPFYPEEGQDDPERPVTHWTEWNFGNITEDSGFTDDCLITREPCDSPAVFFRRELDHFFPARQQKAEHETEEEFATSQGMRHIMDLIIAQPAFQHSRRNMSEEDEANSYVLLHNDLDLQNILTDEDGNVTGIIDWDGCIAVPRSIGCGSFPLFLRKDWRHGYSPTQLPLMVYNWDYYREIYTAEMKALGAPDAHFTGKSHIYHALYDAMYWANFESAVHLVTRVIREVPQLRHVDPVWVVQRVTVDRQLFALLRRGIKDLFSLEA